MIESIDIGQYLIAIAVTLLLWGVLSGGVHWSTDLVKVLTRMAADKLSNVPFLRSIGVTGRGSFLTAGIIAVAAAYNFDLSLFGDFSEFEALDPELAKLLTGMIAAWGSNKLHSGSDSGSSPN